jgi:hypothetical protein
MLGHSPLVDVGAGGVSADEIVDHLDRKGLQTLHGNGWGRSADEHIGHWIRRGRRE